MKMQATFTFIYEASPASYGERDVTPTEMAAIDQKADPWELFEALMSDLNMQITKVVVEPLLS